MKRLQRYLAVGVFLFLAFGVQVASAAPTSTGAGSGTPGASSISGIDSLVEAPPIRGSAPEMLFEEYGPTDYELTQPSDFQLVNVVNDNWNAYASVYGFGLYLMGVVVARLTEWAFSLDLINQLGPVVNSFTHSLVSTLYTQYLPVMIVLAAVAAGWAFLVMRRFLRGVTGILWAGLMIALATAMFVNPSGMLQTADEIGTGVTNAVITGVAQEDPGNAPDAYQINGKNGEVRLLANRVFTVCVYDPWTMIEFGAVDPTENGNQLGIDLLEKNAGQPNTYSKDISAAPQWMQDWANGDDGFERAAIAMVMFVISAVMLLLILISCLTVIVAGLVAVFLGCLIVPVALVAVIPGFGQRVVMSWLMGLIGAFAVSTIAALYLVLVLCLLGALQALSGTVGLFVVAFLDLAMIVIAFWMRKSFFTLGRHAARLPVALATNQNLPAPRHEVKEASATSQKVHRAIGTQRARVASLTESYAKTGSFSGASVASKAATTGKVAKAGAGAGVGGAATASAAAGPAAPIAFGALMAAHIGMKGVQGVMHLNDRARRHIEHHGASMMGMTSSGAGSSRLVHEHNEEGSLMTMARVTQRGVKSVRTPRVDKPKALPASSAPARTWGDGKHVVRPPRTSTIKPPETKLDEPK